MSPFYSRRFEQRFPVPLLAIERLAALEQLPPEQSIPQVLKDCCGVVKPDEDDLRYFLERINEVVEQKAEDKPEVNPDIKVKPTKTLGTSFSNFLGKLDTPRILLWACGWDFEKAQYWYTQVDRTITMQMIEDFLAVQHERNTYQFETVLYGFGGGYKDDTQEESTEDWSNLDAAGLMKALMG